MSISAEQQIYDTFLAATEYVPQVPHGCVMLGHTALELDAAGKLRWADMLHLPLEDAVLEQAVRRTDAVHAQVKLPPNRGLYIALPFAFELVRADLASALPATEKQDTIGPMTPDLAQRSATFMEDPGSRTFAFHALGEAMKVLRSTEVKRGIGKYQAALVEVAEHYRGSTDASGRMQAMNVLRQSVTDLTRGPMTDRLRDLQTDAPAGLDMAVVAHNLTRWEPSPELAAKHFG